MVGTQHCSVHAIGFKAPNAEEIHGGANDISNEAKIMKFPAMLLSLVTLRDFSSPFLPIALCSQAMNTIFSSKDEIKHQ